MNSQTLQKVTSAKTATVADLHTHSDKRFNTKLIRDAVIDAMQSVENTRQKCIYVGQLLNEVQEQLEHGEFEGWIEKNIPEISPRTARNWARAACNIVKALPPLTIDISVSDILITPEQDLPAAAKKYKQLWLDLTEGRTIRECLAGVFVDGDEGHRVDRAVNGKTKGGTRGEDRKDFPLFIGVKMKDMATHFSHWKKFTPLQRSETEQILRGAILGQDVSLTRGSHTRLFDFAGTERTRALWPRELCVLALAVLKERLKQTEEKNKYD